jgi:hypothetical protein
MDESEYRDLYHSVNQLRCCFEKAMLTRRFGCAKLVKINIADREAAACADQNAQAECKALLGLLRKNAAFALKTASTHNALPHAKEIKAQCGGIIGIAHVLQTEDEPPTGVDDIHACIQQAIQTYGSLEQLPYPEIVKTITHFEGRKKRNRRR